MAVTLTVLRDRIRQRADMENATDFIPDSELNTYVNSAYKELYGMLLHHDMMRTETTQSITITGAASYSLPSDYFVTIGVFEVIDTEHRRIPRSRVQDRPFAGVTNAGDAYEYRTANDSIELYPHPTAGTYVHIYVPLITELSADSDTMNGVNGWEEFIILDAAIKCLHKEESDARHLQIEREGIRERIRMEAEGRDLASTHFVNNRRRAVFSDPGDNWPRRGDSNIDDYY